MNSAAVLLTCHGTVDRVDDLPAFLANIRHGRPTPQAIVNEVARRFEHIGGSPLMRTTLAQAAALSQRLGVPVHAAARLWHPYPKDVLAELARDGVRAVVSLPLAPQSVHVYHAAVRAAAAEHADLEIREAPAWGLEPALIDAFVETIDEALARLPEADRAAIPVILTAHSLPRRVIDAGDPYERDFRAMAGEVAERIEARGNPVEIAFQSQGMDGGAWLGPDLPSAFSALAERGARAAVVAPIGFVADHIETLYDLDVEAPGVAAKAGIERVERASAVNARTRFIDALEAVCRRML